MQNSNKSILVVAGISVVTVVVLVVGILAGGVFLSPYIYSNASASELPQSVSDTDLIVAFEQTMVNVYDDTLPSVVDIEVATKFPFDLSEEDEEALPEDHEEFFNRGGGSGFVWDTEGHIVTNDHVVGDATEILVTFADDTTVEAVLVGTDPDSDLAVIKVEMPAGALKPVKLGDSDSLRVGQLAIAIGNPFGQEFTMTSGIVSAVGRLISGGNSGFSIPAAIQTDASINPGNSGGPLLNRNGEVIGINAQMFSRTGASSGIGFSIPVNIAKKVIPALIEGDEYEYAWLGISGGGLTPELAELRDLPADTKGAVILEVFEDGPADDAGLHGVDASLIDDEEAFRVGGDIITAINGEPVHNIGDLVSYLVESTSPGDEVTLDTINADGDAVQVTVTLGVRPSATSLDE